MNSLGLQIAGCIGLRMPSQHRKNLVYMWGLPPVLTRTQLDGVSILVPDGMLWGDVQATCGLKKI